MRSQSILWVAFLCLWCGHTATAKGENAPQSPPVEGTEENRGDHIVSRDRSFWVPLEFALADGVPAKPVQIYVSADKGQSWKLHAKTRQGSGSFPFTARDDGEYWFFLRLGDQRVNGTSLPAGTQPWLKVLVDTTPPEVQLRGEIVEGQLILDWMAEDQNLDHDSIRMEYRTRSIPRWTRLPMDSKNHGRDRWQPPEEPMEIRLRVLDLARNEGVRRIQLGPTGWSKSVAEENQEPMLGAAIRSPANLQLPDYSTPEQALPTHGWAQSPRTQAARHPIRGNRSSPAAGRTWRPVQRPPVDASLEGAGTPPLPEAMDLPDERMARQSPQWNRNSSGEPASSIRSLEEPSRAVAQSPELARSRGFPPTRSSRSEEETWQSIGRPESRKPSVGEDGWSELWGYVFKAARLAHATFAAIPPEPHLTAQVTTWIVPTDTRVSLQSHVNVQIRSMPVRTVSLWIPTPGQSSLRVTGPGVVGLESRSERGDWVLAKVALAASTMGTLPLLVTYDLPIPENEGLRKVALRLPRPETRVPVSGSLFLTTEGLASNLWNAEGLERLDAKLAEIPSELRTSDRRTVAEAFRFQTLPGELELRTVRPERVTPHVHRIERVDIALNLNADGGVVAFCSLAVRGEPGKHLEVILPRDAECLRCTVGERPQSLEKICTSGEPTRLKLALSESGTGTQRITILYQEPSPGQVLRTKSFFPFGSVPWNVNLLHIVGQDSATQVRVALRLPESFVELRLPKAIYTGEVASPFRTASDPDFLAFAELNDPSTLARQLAPKSYRELAAGWGPVGIYEAQGNVLNLQIDHGYLPSMRIGMSLALALGMVLACRQGLQSKLMLVLIGMVGFLTWYQLAGNTAIVWTEASFRGLAVGLVVWALVGAVRLSAALKPMPLPPMPPKSNLAEGLLIPETSTPPQTA